MLQGMALFFGETPQCNQIPAREDRFLDLDHSSREVPHPAMTILQTSVSTKGPQSTEYNPSGRVVGASFLLCAKTHCFHFRPLVNLQPQHNSAHICY
jgi:hypothetical protein